MSTPAPRLYLLGTGTVGSAFIERHARLREADRPVPEIAGIANARGWRDCDASSVQAALPSTASTAPASSASPSAYAYAESCSWLFHMRA